MTRTQPCTSLPPGLTLMTHGVDIAELDLFQLDPTTSLPVGIKQSIYNLTCDNNKWSDGSVVGKKFQMPDQISTYRRWKGIYSSGALISIAHFI